jgi:CDP-paratose 2-epimerase
MSVAIITGSAGLIGSESVEFFASRFDVIAGIDNNMRQYFFGAESSTEWNRSRLERTVSNYIHHTLDIRDYAAVERIFLQYGSDIGLIVHAAAQPSHDWAATEPLTDFHINGAGTLNLLELTRLHAPKAVFIFTSTNKVYGDNPNSLPLVEQETRWEIDEKHPYFAGGIDENLSLDNTRHSIFGASKMAADIMAQEYGKYFGMNVGIFRGGCLTGPKHSGAQLHGFLAYLMKCAITKKHYTIFGYKGKQVRDNIHSLDLVNLFWHFFRNPKQGEAYNVGGGRFSNCSMIEGIRLCESITGNKMDLTYSEESRIGDHIWYISDMTKFKKQYPEWSWKYNLEDILSQMYSEMRKRL